MNIPYSSQAPCPHSAHGYSSAGHQLVDDLSSRRMAPQSESEPRIYPGGRRGRGPDAIWGRPGPSTAKRARSLCIRQACASERTGPAPSNDEGGRYSARPPSRLREDQPGGVAKERPVPPRRTGVRRKRSSSSLSACQCSVRSVSCQRRRAHVAVSLTCARYTFLLCSRTDFLAPNRSMNSK